MPVPWTGLSQGEMRHTIGTMVQAFESAWLHSRRQLRTASARINRTKAPLLGRPPINSPFPCCSSPLCLHPAWHPPCFGLWVIAWPGHRFAPLEIHVAAGTIRGTNFVRARRNQHWLVRATRSVAPRGRGVGGNLALAKHPDTGGALFSLPTQKRLDAVRTPKANIRQPNRGAVRQRSATDELHDDFA